MSMKRKLMRSVIRVGGNRAVMSGNVSLGTQRAGMHQRSEHAWQHARMSDAEQTVIPPEEVPVEEALDLPAELEAEIPPEDEEIASETASEDGVLAADGELLEEISDPDMAANEEEEGVTEEQFAVDCSGERVPVLDPVTGGVDADPRELTYDPGDGEPKLIQLPSVFQMAVEPSFAEIENPSANVPAAD